MQTADLVIHPEWLAPVTGPLSCLEHHSVAIRDGIIVDVAPRAEIEQRYQAAETRQLPQQILIPGLINMHTHSAMTLMRGLADDTPLMTWLQEHIWPAEHTHVSDAFVYDGTRLACAEMLLSGTTCFNDMYFFPEATLRAGLEAGMRVSTGIIVIDFPSAYAAGPAEYLEKGLALREEYRDHPMAHFTLAPHAPYTVNSDTLTQIAQYSAELDLRVHMHVHETAFETTDSVTQHGHRPLQRLAALGLVNERLLAVHMTQLTDDEIAQVSAAGCHILHCPESNMKLASGAAPVASLRAKGANVCLGTDGAASNNDLDLFTEMRSAALLAKLHSGDPTALAAHEALEMATLSGARALGLEQQIGSIEIGKKADLTAVSLAGAHAQPVYHPISQLVYSCTGRDVTHVWVDGAAKVRDGQLVAQPLDDILATAREWRDRIRAS